MDFLRFISRLGNVLYDLFVYSKGLAQGGEANPETEKVLAMRIIRKASDEEMLKELSL